MMIGRSSEPRCSSQAWVWRNPAGTHLPNPARGEGPPTTPVRGSTQSDRHPRCRTTAQDQRPQGPDDAPPTPRSTRSHSGRCRRVHRRSTCGLRERTPNPCRRRSSQPGHTPLHDGPPPTMRQAHTIPSTDYPAESYAPVADLKSSARSVRSQVSVPARLRQDVVRSVRGRRSARRSDGRDRVG